MLHRLPLLCLCGLLFASMAKADVGDPQIGTDHPWYPGELACSTYERLFATQAELYEPSSASSQLPTNRKRWRRGCGGTLTTIMAKKEPKISGVRVSPKARTCGARILDRPVRRWLRLVWHDAFAMDGGNGSAAGPRAAVVSVWTAIIHLKCSSRAEPTALADGPYWTMTSPPSSSPLTEKG